MKQVDMSNSELGSDAGWVSFMNNIGQENSKEFLHFRRHPIMLTGVEGTNYFSLFQNIDFFRKQNGHIVTTSLEKIASSDLIGAPLRTFTANINQKYLTINPTTAKYAKNWANIIDCFGSETLFTETTITEIGGGYGGESKVFFDIAFQLGKKPDSVLYEVYDLPSSENLITKFLDHFGYSVSFKKLGENIVKKDNALKRFVISNGALSEMRGQLLWSYLNEVVLNADYGYFIVNFDTHSKPYDGGISDIEFYDWLVENGKNPTWLDEETFLTKFDVGASKVIVFGAKNDLIQTATSNRKRPRFFQSVMFRMINSYSTYQLTNSSLTSRIFRLFFD